MKTAFFLVPLFAFVAAPLFAADAADEVKAAAKKLSDTPNYAWTAKSESPQSGSGRGGGGFGPASGKVDSGLTYIAWQGQNSKTEAIKKGEKFVIKSGGDEWQTGAELEDGGGDNNRGRFTARRVQNFKAPGQEAVDLIGRVKNLKKDGEAYSAELTPEALKQMYSFGRRPGSDAGSTGPDISGLKGTAKFWVKDGVLSKYQTHVQGKMTFGQDGREIAIDRATTYEITDIGTAKISVPAEAKKKLG